MYASYSRNLLNSRRTESELVGKEVTVTTPGGDDLTGTVEAVNIVNSDVARVRIGDDWYDNFRPAQ
jgi:hypothetical protein